MNGNTEKNEKKQRNKFVTINDKKNINNFTVLFSVRHFF